MTGPRQIPLPNPEDFKTPILPKDMIVGEVYYGVSDDSPYRCFIQFIEAKAFNWNSKINAWGYFRSNHGVGWGTRWGENKMWSDVNWFSSGPQKSKEKKGLAAFWSRIEDPAYEPKDSKEHKL